MSTAIYNRISQDTTGEGDAVARQEKECRALAKKLGWNSITVFTDNDISASSGKYREHYEALVDSIREGDIDRLIVWHPDRLHRRPIELEAFIEVVEKSKLEIASVQAGSYDLNTPGGRMIARMLGAAARAEMEIKSARQKSSNAQAALAGKPYQGNRSFGWTYGMKSVIPTEAALIREAANRVIGGEAVNAIAADFNSRGIATVKGGLWRGQVIRKMLIKPQLAGLRCYRGEVVGDGNWTPILERDIFAQLEGILTDPKRIKARRGNKYPLTGLMVDHRGYPMVGTTSTKPGLLRYRTNTPSGVFNSQIGAATVEPNIIEAILAKSDTESFPLLEGSALDIETVKSLEAELAELADLKAEHKITTIEWLRVRESVAAELEVAQGSVRAVRAVPGWLRDLDKPGVLRKVWDTLDDGKKRRVIELFVERIVIAPHSAEVQGGDRIHVDWKG